MSTCAGINNVFSVPDGFAAQINLFADPDDKKPKLPGIERVPFF